jgi:negative regulator of flagellin synthesis FlgM
VIHPSIAKLSTLAKQSTAQAMESPALRNTHAGLAARHTRGETPMNVNNVGSTSPIQKLTTNPIQKSIPADPPANIKATDRLELSGSSHLLAALKTNDIRADKVASIKAQIADGSYETDDKLDSAVGKLLDDLNK